MATDPFDLANAMTTEPESLLVGSYQAWRRLLDYDGGAFTLSYRFMSVSDFTTRTVSGTYDAANRWWSFTVGASDTSGWTIGTYRWDLVLTRNSDGEAMVLATGTVELFASDTDRRTHAEIMVQKIESILSGRADSDVESYSIKSRSITKMSVKELREWRDYYLTEIARTGGSSTGAKRVKNNKVRVRWV
jgi:hypothetical protein